MSIRDILASMVAEGATDIVFSAGSPPCVRVAGELRPHGVRPVSAESMQRMLEFLLDDAQRAEFARAQECDLATQVAGVGRFRVNVYRQRGAISVALRPLGRETPTLEALHLPPSLAELCALEEGLVLVAGTAASGRSSTLAALVDGVNATRAGHVVTVEASIEFEHPRKRCLVEQRQVGRDTRSYSEALQRVRRQGVDVVMVAELPDLETIAAALRLAESGRLVLACVDAPSAAQAVDRLAEVFPVYQVQQVRHQLSWSLKAVVCQQLLPGADGRSWRPACEVLRVDDAVAKMLREGRSHLIDKAIAEGSRQGMQTMDDAIAALVEAGQVRREALARLATPRAVEAPGGGGETRARALEKQLYSSDAATRRGAEEQLKAMEAQGDQEASTILRQFTQFYVTNFEDKKIGLKR